MSEAIAIRKATEPISRHWAGSARCSFARTTNSIPQRFMAPGAIPKRATPGFSARSCDEEDVVVLVAEQQASVVGYVYAGLEPQSWKELREACGFIHDVVVDERGRRTGVATALIEAAAEWLRERGAPRVMLWTAHQNERRAAALRAPGLPSHDDRDDARALGTRCFRHASHRRAG